jgi:hypothetical protein
MGMLASANLAGIDGTPYVVLFALFLTVVAVTTGIPGLRLWWTAGRAVTPARRVARRVSAGILMAVAAASTYGAGWLFVTAHRGDYLPYPAERAGCKRAASEQSLSGSQRRSYIAACVANAVD